MRAWLYYRLSNEDDKEQNSLQNQRAICAEYADRHGFTVVGESSDENASGMGFSRLGISKLTQAAAQERLDAVIVKDFSRLGRHRTQTALFLDFLREQNVQVISATEHLNSFEEKDDLTISVRGLMNDYYAKDIGKKVRAGYRQKQKEGIVITPPFGYWKDKNTGDIKIAEEAAQTVRMIYHLFLDGVGLKEIARNLNEQGCKTPAQLQNERCGKRNPQLKRYLWSYTSVKNVLTDESYTGVLCNHKRETKDGQTCYIPQSDQYRHEGFYPPLISSADWHAVQSRWKYRMPRQKATDNKAKHRYAGLLVCSECENPFVPLKRYGKDSCRIEYVCKGYHRYGKVMCLPHRVREEAVDQAVWDKLNCCRKETEQAFSKIKELQKHRALREPILNARCFYYKDRIKKLEQEIDEIMMEKLALNGSQNPPL